MTREYMIVYEKVTTNWSAFSPDVPGCGSLGDDLTETRLNMREALELYLRESIKAGEPVPEATAANVDFREFDPDHETKEYFVEWLAVPLPESATHKNTVQAA